MNEIPRHNIYDTNDKLRLLHNGDLKVGRFDFKEYSRNDLENILRTVYREFGLVNNRLINKKIKNTIRNYVKMDS
jgi:hypothetical protein